MKLQSLVAIFLIIIVPIVIVLSIYVENLVDVADKEARINQALINATYDSVRAYQMNTFNENYSTDDEDEFDALQLLNENREEGNEHGWILSVNKDKMKI